MKLQMQSIHFNADQKLLDYIQKKVDKLETFYDRILNGEVYLHLDNTDQKNNKLIHIKLYIPGSSIIAKEQGASFEEATDLSYEVLKKQLMRQKEKLSSF
jgi:putative sigma-54 modulation protein